MAINCKRTRNCINLFEYFLLAGPPLNNVPIPKINTTATAIISAIAVTLIKISDTIKVSITLIKKKK